MKTLIIAEAGVNHNGDPVIAKKLIDVAAKAGADYVKFQMFKAETLATLAASKADYQKQDIDEHESQFAMLKKLEISKIDYKNLIDHSNKCGIKIFSTGFDVETNNMLHAFGQEIFKVPSGEITNLPYLRNIGEFGLQVILSTGMSSLAEIDLALRVLEKAGTPLSSISVLQCTTAYPAPMEEVNLLAMHAISKQFGVAVGFSDHTLGIEASIAATALGATIIEKHFTLDRNMSGPDHKASLEPSELKNLVTSIRNVELSLGDGVKKPTKSEMSNMDVARKSIVASAEILKGEIFTESNLTTKRPGNGISPMKWDEIVGLKARRNFTKNELIEL
jgi:N,N'-diacetyllegionaminate synthase